MRQLSVILVLAGALYGQGMLKNINNETHSGGQAAPTYCYPITVPDASISATLTNYVTLVRNPQGTVTTVTAAGLTTLTKATGDSFPSWFDNTMSVMVNGAIYPISSLTSSTILVVIGTITNGTYSWNGFPQLSYGITGSRALNSNGYDIGFYSDSGCTTKLKWETVSWTAATGVGEWWIQKTLTDGGATNFYIGYGNSATVTDQSSPVATWTDANFVFVAHMGNGTTLSAADSTGLNTSPNYPNGTPTPGAGTIDGASVHVASNGDTINYTTASAVQNLANDFTISLWAKVATSSLTAGLIKNSNNGAGFTVWMLNGSLYLSTNSTDYDFSYTTPVGSWVFLSFYFDSSDDVSFYNNGAFNVKKLSATDSTTGNTLTIANQGGNIFNGSLDELRLRSGASTADWIAADYLNQNTPFTFWSTTAQ